MTLTPDQIHDLRLSLEKQLEQIENQLQEVRDNCPHMRVEFVEDESRYKCRDCGKRKVSF